METSGADLNLCLNKHVGLLAAWYCTTCFGKIPQTHKQRIFRHLNKTKTELRCCSEVSKYTKLERVAMSEKAFYFSLSPLPFPFAP